MQYAYANISLYRSWYAYLREGKRVFSFDSKPKISKQEYWTKNKKQAVLSKLISLFWKQSKGEESLFLKEKQEAHYMHMHSIFHFFLKLQYFLFWWDSTNEKETKEHRELKSLWGQSEIECLMLTNDNDLISIKKNLFNKQK